MPDKLFQIENRAGQPVNAGQVTITPLSQAVTIRLPGRVGGVVWNRPIGVVIAAPGQEEQVLPIRDVTRLVQVLLLTAGLLTGITFWFIYKRK